MDTSAHISKSARITRNVIALGFVSLFTDAASEMIYPLVPVFITLLGSNVLILGVIEGIAETTSAMLKLISGIISDKIGKRKLLVVLGYGTSTLIRPITGAVSAAWQIIFVRMIDRIGKGIRTAPRDALIASSTDDSIRGKAYGFHRAMDHAGAVIGPILALFTLIILFLVFKIQDTVLILRWTFLLAIIPGLFALLALILFVQEKAAPVSSTKKVTFSLKQFDRKYIIYLSIVTLFTLGNSSDAFLLFRVQDALHHSKTLYSTIYSTPIIGDMVGKFGDLEAQKKLIDILFIPLVWAFFHIIKVIFSTHLGALSDKMGRKIVINIGWGIYAFVYFAFAFLDRLPDGLQIVITFVLFAIYALYYAFCEGAEKAFVADVVKPELCGSAFGLFNFATGLSALPASVIFGLLYKKFGAMAAFGTGATIACTSMLLFAIFVKERSKRLRS
ncbi:MAG: MFS transporter [Candidatus Aminicenantes bacterium]|nr:MFS transporter [Candidatus Aminicenantes bacterium]